jgi:hypothetical protein
MAYSPRLQQILETARQQIREGQWVSHEEFWAARETARSPKRRGRKRKSA